MAYQLALILPIFVAFIGSLFSYYDKINVGIAIVKESSRAVCQSLGSFLFPLVAALIRVFFLLFSIYVIIKAFYMRITYYKVHGDTNVNCSCTMKYSNGDTCIPQIFNQDCHSPYGGACVKANCKLESQVMDPLGIVVMVSLKKIFIDVKISKCLMLDFHPYLHSLDCWIYSSPI